MHDGDAACRVPTAVSMAPAADRRVRNDAVTHQPPRVAFAARVHPPRVDAQRMDVALKHTLEADLRQHADKIRKALRQLGEQIAGYGADVTRQRREMFIGRTAE